MRAGALSNDTVISLLNTYFVPVYTSGADYDEKAGAAPAEEKKAWNKIYHEAIEAKLSTGTVHVYVLTPEGRPIDSIHVAAATPEKVIAVLKKTIEKLGTREGKTLVEPRPQDLLPKVEPETLALHLTARAVDSNGSGFYHDLPGEDWIVYPREEWTKFLPPAGAATGAKWDVDRAVAIKLLNQFYPTVEDSGTFVNDFKQVSMKATLVSNEQVRLDVSMKMVIPRAGSAMVETTAVGVLHLDPAKRTIKKFSMATEKTAFNGGKFGVAVRSVSR